MGQVITAIKDLPEVGSVKRRTARPKVVLPQPDSPTRPRVSPRWISSVTPPTALTTLANDETKIRRPTENGP